ncbi:MAG: hypothetical protein WKF54_04710 [Nocardioidaceae bacterium]
MSRAHLRRLGALADDQHAELTRPSAEGGNLFAWASRRVAVVLAQGAALHYRHPDGPRDPLAWRRGVKDLDVWTFYATIPGRPLRTGRYELCRDFGPSSLGCNRYPAPHTGEVCRWNEFTGRRVDLLARDVPIDSDASVDGVVAALRNWLASGAAKACMHLQPKGRSPSPHWLAHKAMVWIGTPETRRRAGKKVWDVHTDAPHLLNVGGSGGSG